MSNDKELELLRERTKEYRELLEVAYSLLYRPGPKEAQAFEYFWAKLREHGIPESEQRPILEN